MVEIVQDEGIRSGSPRIEGSRITVLDVKRRVIDQGEDPHVVAGEYDISLGDLFRALAYYDDNREDFQARERKYALRRQAGERATQDVLDNIHSRRFRPRSQSE